MFCDLAIKQLQYVGTRSKRRSLLLQHVDGLGTCLPVDLNETTILAKSGERFDACSVFTPLFFEARYSRTDCHDIVFSRSFFYFQRSDFVVIAPTEHKSTAIINGMTIVLFVAFVAALDLTCARDRLRFATKLILRFATGHVKSTTYFRVQPIVVFAIGFYFKLLDQRVAVEAHHLHPRSATDTVINKTRTEMRAVHPFGNLRITRVGHQKRETEVVQQPFSSTGPVLLVSSHLNQLTYERQFQFLEAQSPAQSASQLDLAAADVATTRLQAIQILHQQRVVFAQ